MLFGSSTADESGSAAANYYIDKTPRNYGIFENNYRVRMTREHVDLFAFRRLVRVHEVVKSIPMYDSCNGGIVDPKALVRACVYRCVDALKREFTYQVYSPGGDINKYTLASLFESVQYENIAGMYEQLGEYFMVIPTKIKADGGTDGRGAAAADGLRRDDNGCITTNNEQAKAAAADEFIPIKTLFDYALFASTEACEPNPTCSVESRDRITAGRMKEGPDFYKLHVFVDFNYLYGLFWNLLYDCRPLMDEGAAVYFRCPLGFNNTTQPFDDINRYFGYRDRTDATYRLKAAHTHATPQSHIGWKRARNASGRPVVMRTDTTSTSRGGRQQSKMFRNSFETMIQSIRARDDEDDKELLLTSADRQLNKDLFRVRYVYDQSQLKERVGHLLFNVVLLMFDKSASFVKTLLFGDTLPSASMSRIAGTINVSLMNVSTKRLDIRDIEAESGFGRGVDGDSSVITKDYKLQLYGAG